MSGVGEKRKDGSSPPAEELEVKKPKVDETAEKDSGASKLSKKSKKKSLRAKYDAIEAEDDPESNLDKNDGQSKPVNEVNGDEGSEVEEDYEEDEDEESEAESDTSGEDFDDAEDEVEEDFEELSEPDVEPGSRRRRQPVDYNKVLAELEAEEKARGQ